MSHIKQREDLSAFFAYPNKANFGRVIPKNKIYEHSKTSSSLKELFVEQVDQIIWQYKLAPETINLNATLSVPEIQIFSIKLKSDDLHLDVLRCIDEAVQFPIIFELHRHGEVNSQMKVAAAYKYPRDSTSSIWALSAYFSTPWVGEKNERSPLPLALDLQKLYEQLLRPLLPLAARKLETLDEQIRRYEQVVAKRAEVEKMANRLAKERQFNRKVEYNAVLRQLKAELEVLLESSENQ